MADPSLVKVQGPEDLQDRGEETEALVLQELVNKIVNRPQVKHLLDILSSMIIGDTKISFGMIGKEIHYLLKVTMAAIGKTRTYKQDRDVRLKRRRIS